ncbi:MAG: DUF177 domain-containing protein [Acidobacteria bacterium]|nr:DUF177 domain-containing protein [Acidobacteriota bacterium]
MIIDITKLEVGTTHVAESFSADGLDFDYRDYHLADDWRLEVDIHKNSRAVIQMTGTIRGTVQVYCDRCLKPFAFPVEQSFDICMLPVPPDLQAHDLELGEDQLNENYYVEPAINLKQIVREQIILELPLKMICAEDCAGLCYKCGANRNETVCDCDLSDRDPRWSVLLELKKKMNENN